MDPRQYLVLIKGKDHTGDVLRVAQEAGRTVVTFKNGKSYRYTPNNVQWLSNPEPISAEDCRVFIYGDMVSDVREALRFGNWIKVFHESGNTRVCPSSAFSIQNAKASNGRSKDVLSYFEELAKGAALRTDEGESLLAMKYRELNVISRRSILSSYLQGQSPVSKPVMSEQESPLIFPFSCNMSQKAAVQASLQNPVSLVQGPPGTGKTQTILNLIANLLLQRKRVAVVSNNNSATSNVLEKLKNAELDFVTASLGSAGNKTAFIEAQKIETIQLPSLSDREEDSVCEEILHLNHELDKTFNTQNELAEIIRQIDAYRLELAHYESFQRETESYGSNEMERRFLPKVSARKLMNYWLACERKAGSYVEKIVPMSSTSQFTISESLAQNPHREASRNIGFLAKLLLLLQFGLAGRALFKLGIRERIRMLQKAYYLRKIEELENSRKRLETVLQGFGFDEHLERLTELSMQLLKHSLANRYNNRTRNKFSLDDLRKRPEEFLNEYPVVLSTTFSVSTSVQNGYLFDCVIVDEASQVDLLTGILAMGCAEKLVIVGDPMQLPCVLTEQDKKRAIEVAERYELPEHARFERHNLLSSVRDAFPDIPKTLLREHYRCHPKIIDFCNQKFYGGELLVMTRDQGEPDVLKAYVTVEGKHARGTFNQRQIDEIAQRVLRELGSDKLSDIGIVSPYRMQADRMVAAVGSKEIEIDTVHKYQGREKRIMVITTVSNDLNEFVDNPNLLNVAISRAQDKLRIVVSMEMAESQGNIADFIRYIRYRNCEVVSGKIRSIFDLLYSEYTEVRLNYLRKRKRISAYDSENLVHGEIVAVLQETPYRSYGAVSQFPLSMLVRDSGQLTIEESSYTFHPWTKTDFLIYRKVDKSPVLVIEVDGYAFHREGTRQAERDSLKNSVLWKCGLPILRLSTVGSNERDLIRKKLEEVVGGKGLVLESVGPSSVLDSLGAK